MLDHRVNKDLVTRFIREVWSEGDVDASDRYIAPTYTIHHDPGDRWDGRQLDLSGYKERVRLSRAPFPDQTFELQQLFADGDAVVVTWLWTATHRGDIPGFPATGNRIAMSGATVYYLAGQRITGHWQITDRLSVYRQLRRAAGGGTHG
jgi:predicted ester cyclase